MAAETPTPSRISTGIATAKSVSGTSTPTKQQRTPMPSLTSDDQRSCRRREEPAGRTARNAVTGARRSWSTYASATTRVHTATTKRGREHADDQRRRRPPRTAGRRARVVLRGHRTGDVQRCSGRAGPRAAPRVRTCTGTTTIAATRTSWVKRARYSATAESRISPIPRGRSSDTMRATLGNAAEPRHAAAQPRASIYSVRMIAASP